MYSEKQKKYYQEYQKLNSEKVNDYNKKSYAKNREGRLTHIRAYQNEVKRQVFTHYSNGTMACKCCEISGMPFLSVDHIEGNGARHRREIGVPTGIRFYFWLRKNNFPKGFQILCHNCNQAKWIYGECPHKELLIN